MYRTVLCLLISFFWADFSLAQVLCGDQPKDVPLEVPEQLKGDVEGKAQLFTKLLGQAELKGTVDATKREVYQKHRDIDKSQIDRYMAWVSCQNIMSDRSLNAIEKNRLWIDVYRELRSERGSWNIDFLRKLRIKQTSISYVRSVLGTPISDNNGLALFEKDGYEIKVGYYVANDNRPELTGSVFSIHLRVPRTMILIEGVDDDPTSNDNDQVPLILDGDWNPWCPNTIGPRHSPHSHHCPHHRAIAATATLGVSTLGQVISNPAMLPYLCDFVDVEGFPFGNGKMVCSIQGSVLSPQSVKLYLEQIDDMDWAGHSARYFLSILDAYEQPQSPKDREAIATFEKNYPGGDSFKAKQLLADELKDLPVVAMQIYIDRSLSDDLAYLETRAFFDSSLANKK